MNALIFGAGKIARGFLGQILELSDYRIDFVDANEFLVNEISNNKEFTVHVLGDKSKDTVVSVENAYHTSESEKIWNSLMKADVIFTSVGGNGLKSVGHLIADILNKYGTIESYKSIITCENVNQAATVLANEIYNNLDNHLVEITQNYLGITESAVMRTATERKANEVDICLDVWVQDFWSLPVDKERYKGKNLNIISLEFVDNFGNMLTQKMYTFNASHAVIAYNAHYLNFDTIAEAANSNYLSKILDSTYEEINKILITSLKVDAKKQNDFSRMARKKYTDYVIVDKVERVAFDPIRKLARNERLVGPALLAVENNINPSNFIDAIVKAIYYFNENDKSSVKLNVMLKKEGIESVLKKILNLNIDEKLYKLILDHEKYLIEKGVINGGK